MTDQSNAVANDESQNSSGSAKAPDNLPAGAADSPSIDSDGGVPRGLAGWGIVVGLIIATGGAAMVVLFAQVPQALATLTLCVGFGIVLAAFGSRAAGNWGGFAVVGAGGLAVVLFLLLEHYLPQSLYKRGSVSGDFSKVADLRIVDEDPLYSRRDRTTGQIRFIILDDKFKTAQVLIQVDTTEKGSGVEYFQMVGDGQKIAQKYLRPNAPVITWTFDYNRRQVRDGADVIFRVPEELDEEIVGGRRRSGSLLQLLSPMSSVMAAEGTGWVESLISALKADDPAARRNARDGLTARGVAAVAPLMAALAETPDDYRLKGGAISVVSDILRSDESLRGQISAALSPSDIALLSSSAASDSDPTVRLQATDFLYRLKDPRSVAPTLGHLKERADDIGTYNSTLILKGTIPNLPPEEQKRVGAELDASATVKPGSRSKALIDAIVRTLGMR
jgi:hypothetical protein